MMGEDEWTIAAAAALIAAGAAVLIDRRQPRRRDLIERGRAGMRRYRIYRVIEQWPEGVVLYFEGELGPRIAATSMTDPEPGQLREKLESEAGAELRPAFSSHVFKPD